MMFLKVQVYWVGIGYGLGVSVSDINKDGCDDIYISNDFRNDYLYINNCDGTAENLEDYIRHTSNFQWEMILEI